MALYGNVEAAKRLLRASDVSAFSADQDARLAALHLAVSALIEHETGRTFGVGPAVATRSFHAPPSPVLVIDPPVKGVTQVVVNGVTVDPSFYALAMTDRAGFGYGLRRTDGWSWAGTYAGEVVVTGTFADLDDGATGEVPEDVTYAANYLIAERFKLEQASPAGFTGPDGAVVPIRNALKDPIVAKTLAHYRVPASSLVAV